MSRAAGLRRNLEQARLLRRAGQRPWSTRPNEHHGSGEAPAVSVVVTCFDHARHLGECLESVLAADWPAAGRGPLELIVIDDGSSDGSPEVAWAVVGGATLPAVCVSKRLNTGPADARNVGLELARAPLVFLLDADNWIEPGCLARLYGELSSAPAECAAAYGVIRRVNEAGDPCGQLSDHAWDVARLVENPYLDVMALYRAEAVRAVGGFDAELTAGWEDYALWLALAEAGHHAISVGEVLASYRVVSNPSRSVNAAAVARPLRLWWSFRRRFGRLARRYPPRGPALFGLPRSRLVLLAMAARALVEGPR